MDISDLVDRWIALKDDELENNLNAKFTNHILEFLNLPYSLAYSLSGGVKPDFVVFDETENPLLIIETKRRTPNLASKSEQEFVDACYSNNLYKEAVGYDDVAGNGIKQYLSVRDKPAKYGLVFNGDFFQLFKRIDGLIIPLTEVQKVTAETLPRLVQQLKHYLHEEDKAFTVSVWNRKGGVAKTTNTINIAAVLSAFGKRVLLVDFDPQVDLTKSFGIEPENFKYKIIECFDKLQLGEEETATGLLKKLIQEKTFPMGRKTYSISVLPGNKETLEVFGEEKKNADYPDGYPITSKQTALKRLLSLVSNQYDYILIDTSPKADLLTVSSLFAADGLLIPSDYDPETLRHVQDISKNLVPHKIRPHRLKRSHKTPTDDICPRILGLVFSNCSSLGAIMERKVDQSLTNLSIKVYQTKIRRYDMIPISKFAKKPVVFYRPKSPVSKLYVNLTKEIFIQPNFVEK